MGFVQNGKLEFVFIYDPSILGFKVSPYLIIEACADPNLESLIHGQITWVHYWPISSPTKEVNLFIVLSMKSVFSRSLKDELFLRLSLFSGGIFLSFCSTLSRFFLGYWNNLGCLDSSLADIFIFRVQIKQRKSIEDLCPVKHMVKYVFKLFLGRAFVLLPYWWTRQRSWIYTNAIRIVKKINPLWKLTSKSY